MTPKKIFCTCFQAFVLDFRKKSKVRWQKKARAVKERVLLTRTISDCTIYPEFSIEKMSVRSSWYIQRGCPWKAIVYESSGLVYKDCFSSAYNAECENSDTMHFYTHFSTSTVRNVFSYPKNGIVFFFLGCMICHRIFMDISKEQRSICGTKSKNLHNPTISSTHFDRLFHFRLICVTTFLYELPHMAFSCWILSTYTGKCFWKILMGWMKNKDFFPRRSIFLFTLVTYCVGVTFFNYETHREGNPWRNDRFAHVVKVVIASFFLHRNCLRDSVGCSYRKVGDKKRTAKLRRGKEK